MAQVNSYRTRTTDNPITMRREHRIGSVSAALLMSRSFIGGKWFPVELNTGPWKVVSSFFFSGHRAR